jgi:serine phosphatase RsbU (regulator of sigma subunit)
LDEFAAMLSYHFGEAGDTQKALKYCTLAGESALAAYANQEAETQFCCALNLVDKSPEQAELKHLLGEALYRQSRYKEALQAWREGIHLYRELGNDERVARLYARSARAAWHGGDQPEGLRLSQEGLAAVEGMADNPAKAMLIHEAARAYHFNGFPDEAEPLCRQALEMAERLNAVDIQADALTTLGVLPHVPTEEALRSLETAVELAESNGLLEIATRANHNLGVVIDEQRGDLKGARNRYLHAAEFARQRGAAQEELFSLLSAARVSLGLGDLKTGEEIISSIEQINNTLTDPNQVQLEKEESIEFGLHLLKGELQKALEKLRKGRSSARQRGDLQTLQNFCTSIADLFLIQDRLGKIDDWSEAEGAAREMIEINNRGVGDITRSLCLLSAIYVRQGRLEEADQLYTEAQQKAGSSPSFWQEQNLLEINRDLAIAKGQWSLAFSAAEAASTRLAQHEIRFPWVLSLVAWAETHLARGDAMDFERARAIYRESLVIFEAMEAEFYVNIINERLRELRAKSFAVTQALDEMTHELAEASRIQQGLLPEEIPEIPGWEIAAILKPARETSGDFYDFIQLPGERLGFVVADVAGKGMGAALYMATCRSLIRTYAGDHPDQPELALAKTNRRILADTRSGLFITVFYGVLEPASGRLMYCNAGHNPPFLISSENPDSHQALSRTGMPLGISEEASWEQGIVTCQPGDVLVAYTDGITEAQSESHEFYDEARLLGVARLQVGRSALALQQELERDIAEFSGLAPQFDDMTLMVIKRD